MKRSFTVALYITIALTGCAASSGVKNVTLPDGGQGFYIYCDLSGSDWTVCYEQAAKTCNGEYTIIDKNETSTPTVAGPLVRRNMMVDCNK